MVPELFLLSFKETQDKKREPFGSLLFVSTSMNESRSFFVRGLIEVRTVPNDTISYQSISV